MLNAVPIIAFQRFMAQNSGTIFAGMLRLLIIGVVLIAFPGTIANAQGGSTWMPDQRIPGYRDDTFTPFLVADQSGNVHAFASQRLEEGGAAGIVYRKWSLAGGWTTPVDILLSPLGDTIVQSAFLDANGIIHLLFLGGSPGATSIYYSQAQVEHADSIQAWSVPTIIGDNAVGPSYPVLSGDDVGNLVAIYTGITEGGGVYSVLSSDSGLTWSRPEPIFLVNDPELIPFSLRLSQGRNNQIHAVWSVVTLLGMDMSVHYARFDSGTLQWTAPIVLNERIPGLADFFGPSFPSLIDNGSEVIVMYNNGNPLPIHRAGLGRPVQMVSLSKDNGATWEPPTVPFIRHEGRSGEHIVVQDSDQVVHALFVQRTSGEAEILGGIWHSEYKDGFWSDPNRFIPTYDAHDLRAVVSQGNIMLMVWRIDPGVGEKGIWYTYKILDSKELPIAPYPTRQSDIATPLVETVALTPTFVPTRIPPELLEQPLIGIGNPGSALGFGIIIVSLILLVVIVVFAISRNR